MLGELARWLFDPAGLTPHGFCLLWQPGLIWLHGLSDIGIGVSYFTIPVALAAVIRRRSDLAFRPVFALFAGFILLCGIGHWLDLMTLWVPAYGIEGLVKAMTAVVSIITVIAMWKLLPRIVALPSPAQLSKVNEDLLTVRDAQRRMAELAGQECRAREALANELSRRQTAELLALESKERLNIVLQSKVTEALYLLSPDGLIETWNAGAQRIKGYTQEEIIGQSFAVFFTDEDIAIDEPKRILALARESGHFAAEAWRVRKDGSRFLARVAIDAICQPDGTLRGFVKVTQDITKQRIEEAQRDIIVESAPNGLMIVDEAGVIAMANHRIDQIFGYPDGSLVGEPVDILVPGGFGTLRHPEPDMFAGGESIDAVVTQRQFLGRKSDGGALTVEIMLRPVGTPLGHVVVASLSDVTDRVRRIAAQEQSEKHARLAAAATNAHLDRLSRNLAQARDRAEQASQAKSRFLAGITHELRTPLHGILGYAELLTLEGDLTPRQSHLLDVMMACGQHLLGMINSVLDMSQIEADQLELQPADTDLPCLIHICMDVVRPAADAKGLKLIEPTIGPLSLFTDPTRLRQVLINLLGNAVKFTHSGTIEVRLKPAATGKNVRVEVADTGPGIQAAHRDKLFQTFERLNAEQASSVEGQGLGLAIAARLVEKMGGQIGYGDNPGGGSVFWLELPLPAGGSSTAPVVAPSFVPAPGARPLRVLVADDEDLNRVIATKFLKTAGHEVTSVEGGAAAVEAATTGDFDVILMDVRMPGMNGMEATRLIRALPAPRGAVRVVAVTAHAFAQQIEMCRQAGMDAHVSKPFKLAMLLSVLEDPTKPSSRPAPAFVSPVTVAAEPEPDAPIFDRSMFDDVVDSLSAVEARGHLQTLIARSETLLRELRRTAMLGHAAELIGDAHKLAGSAGICGFLAIAAAAKQFEVTAEADGPITETIALRFGNVIEASLPIMRREQQAIADSVA